MKKNKISKLKVGVFLLCPVAAALAGVQTVNTQPSNPSGAPAKTFWDLMKQSKANQSPRQTASRLHFAGIDRKVAKTSALSNAAVASKPAAKTAAGKTTAATKTGAGNTLSAQAIMGPGNAPLSPDAKMVRPWSTPDFYAVPNWAQSPLPLIDTTVGSGTLGQVVGGIHKFADDLPRLCVNSSTATTTLGQCIPVATPDVTTYPGADFYAIELTEYERKLHSDLPATPLRGYRMDPTGTQPQTYSGAQQYLGPAIVAQRNKPVRVLFRNSLQTDVPLPVDETYAGSVIYNKADNSNNIVASKRRAAIHLHGGIPPWISDGTPHQWITPASESVKTPVAGTAAVGYNKGFSFQNVPDMVGASGATCIGLPNGCIANPSLSDGLATLYWTNEQSERLLWFHDHAYGLTRLNVYAGEAAPYMLVDKLEEADLKTADVPGTIINPDNIADAANDIGHLIPLVIQDKTFVPDDGDQGGQLALQDPTWNAKTNALPGTKPTPAGTDGWGKGSFWFPHVYMPNQFPSDPNKTGANGMGRWDFGPWMAKAALTSNTGFANPGTSIWSPAFNNFDASGVAVPLPGTPTESVACTSTAYPGAQLTCPNVPFISGAPEAFMDTPLVNGTAYPSLKIAPDAYQFQILNATNDRSLNLGLYYAATGGPIITIVDDIGTFDPSSTKYNPLAIPAVAEVTETSGGAISKVKILYSGEGYDPAGTPVVTVQRPGKQPGTYTDAVLSATLGDVTDTNGNPSKGITNLTITGGGQNYYAPNTVCKDGAIPDGDLWQCTEVSLIPASPHKSTPSAKNGLSPAVCAGANAVNLNLSGNSLNGVGGGLATAIIGSNNGLKTPTGMTDPNTCWPNSWPSDGSSGSRMVPDPATAGPAIVQIGTEAGLLPKPVVIPSTPLSFEYNRKSATVLSGHVHGLLMGPAERAKIIVDFKSMAPTSGSSVFILYNDAAAPLPGFDPRNDYYTGDDDNTDGGGAPTTLQGYGPNTRTLMQIVVNGSNGNSFDLTKLNNPDTTNATSLGNIFAKYEEKPIVKESWYPAGWGGSDVNNPPTTVIASDTGVNVDYPRSLASIAVGTSSAVYNAVPTVTIPDPKCKVDTSPYINGADYCETAQAVANFVGVPLKSPLNVTYATNSGTSYPLYYTALPTVTITGGGGTGAVATPTFGTNYGVSSFTFNNTAVQYQRANGNPVPPSITVNATGCTVKPSVTLNVNTVNNRYNTTGVTFNHGGLCSANAVVSFTINGTRVAGTGNAETITAVTLGRNVLINLTNPGNNYTSVPTVNIPGIVGGNTVGIGTLRGAGVVPVATAALSATPSVNVTLTNPGKGYTNADLPLAATLSAPASGTAPTLTTTLASTLIPFDNKGIIEGFSPFDGRMNAMLASGIPAPGNALPPFATAPYVDPPTDVFKDGETQIWNLSHVLGVDTHYVHFHLVNVQLINRIGIDGSIRPINPNEYGWRETVRMNPLEDLIVAVRPVKPSKVPFQVPNSIRPLDVTLPLGTVNGPNGCNPNPALLNPAPMALCVPFSIADPAANQVTITNAKVNYGWEFVQHCHLLGHEENDMMRPQAFAVAPLAPTLGTVTKSTTTAGGNRVTINWTDVSTNETDFDVQQATNPQGPWTTLVTRQSSNTNGPRVNNNYSYTTGTLVAGTTYYWRVVANNKVGCDAAPLYGAAANQTCSTLVAAGGGVANGWNVPIMSKPSVVSAGITAN